MCGHGFLCVDIPKKEEAARKKYSFRAIPIAPSR